MPEGTLPKLEEWVCWFCLHKSYELFIGSLLRSFHDEDNKQNL